MNGVRESFAGPLVKSTYVKLTGNALPFLVTYGVSSALSRRFADYTSKRPNGFRDSWPFLGTNPSMLWRKLRPCLHALIARVQFLMNPRATCGIIPKVRSGGAVPFWANPIMPLLGLPGS